MPTGLPSASDIMAQKVAAFSLDTQVFESKSFRLFDGDLNILKYQIPSWINIVLSEIVNREVLFHRIRKANESNQALKSAISIFQKNTGLDVNQLLSNHLNSLNYENNISKKFELEMKDFLSELRGEVLPFDNGKLAKEMFNRYFKVDAPFGNKKDKKAEFPDAAALLTLEYSAKKMQKFIILVSQDDGWADFAAKSEWVYCVKNLEDLTRLFESNTAESLVIKNQIEVELENKKSNLYEKIKSTISRDLPDMDWDASDAYSGSSARLVPEVTSVSVQNIKPDTENLQLWFADHDPSICIVEVLVDVAVKVEIEAEFYIWDSIDRDEVNIGSGSAVVDQKILVTVYLEFSGDLINDLLPKWVANVNLEFQSYSTDGVEIDIDHGDYED